MQIHKFPPKVIHWCSNLKKKGVYQCFFLPNKKIQGSVFTEFMDCSFDSISKIADGLKPEAICCSKPIKSTQPLIHVACAAEHSFRTCACGLVL